MKRKTNTLINPIINSAAYLCERLKRRASEYSVQRGDSDIMEEAANVIIVLIAELKDETNN